MLWLWLGTLSLIPFNINSIDSTLSDQQSSSSIVFHLVGLGRLYLGDTGSTREAAAVCLASILTRPDLEKSHLEEFIKFCTDYIKSRIEQSSQIDANIISKEYFKYIGILFCLNQIFKRGHREKLIPHAEVLLPVVLRSIEVASQTLDRKFLCKLLQRITISFLPPREATWRYQRGFRSLQASLSSQDTKILHSAPNINSIDENPSDVFEELPLQMEEVVACLLSFLGDKDTVVRWSAAKGIGRITMRLDKTLGDDIVNAVIQLFDSESDENFWHGGCLAIAELSRRGLLLPDKLEAVVPNMIKALHFDKLKGSCGVGIHIRDAACYVCWAFARAYTPIIMKKYIKELLLQLLIVSLFDREINCRRAANAAFQENIGRQGHDQFEFGLSIISIADFFSISNRTNTYLQLSKTVASLHEHYYQSFLDYLLNNRIKHWDEDIRILAAKAISQLLRIESFKVCSNDNTINMEDFSLQLCDYRSELTCLNLLLSNCTSDNLNERHGSIFGSAWSIHVLSQKGVKLSSDSLKLIEDVIPILDKKRLYRGRGGEIVRKAVNFFIEMVSRTYVLTSVKLKFVFIDLLNEHLKYPQSVVQITAIQALRQLIFQFFSKIPAVLSSSDENLSAIQQQQNILNKLLTSTVQKYISYLQTNFSNKNEENVAIFRGYTRALGIIPLNMLCANISEKCILHTFIDLLEEFSSMKKTISGEYDAETARNCISSFGELYHKLFPLILRIPLKDDISETPQYYVERFQKLIHIASYDYSVDKRGDTGSWTRIEALRGIFHFLQAYSNYSHSPYDISSTSCSMEDVRVESLVGRKLMTAYGIGEILRATCINSDGKEHYSIWVSYHSESLGDLQAQEENWSSELLPNMTSGVLYFVYDIATLRTSLLKFSETAMVIIAPDVLSSFIELLLKQLAEKLDSVREVAGMILLKVVTEFMSPQNVLNNMQIPDGDVIYDCIHDAAVKLSGDDVTSFSVINWSQPDHVYPILVDIMCRSKLYFHAIFSGYIISMGDITETITKKSTQVLLKQLTLERQMWESTFIESKSVFASINMSFENILEIHMAAATDKPRNKLQIPYNTNYHDRIIHSLMKTLEILLKHGYYEAYFQYILKSPDSTKLINDYHRVLILYYEKIMQELRMCTSIPKIQLGIEILSNFLSNDYQGTLRKRSMTSLILFLAHRYPRIRKCKCFRLDLTTSIEIDAISQILLKCYT